MKQNNVELNNTLRDIFTTPLGELLRRDREEQSKAETDSKEQS